MKKVRYIGESNLRLELTNGKVYDVVSYYKSEKGIFWDDITLINDSGIAYIYDVCDFYEMPLFIDATEEYRNDIINEILE